MVTNEVDHRLQLLRARYAGSLAAKRDALVNAWQGCVGESAGVASRRELAVQVHRLCGSAAAYGYGELGECACAADRLLASPVSPAPDALSTAMHALIDALKYAAASVQATPKRLDGALRVVLVEDDPAQATLIANQLQAHGCEVRIESGSDDLWQTLALWPCHAVVLDYRLHGETAVEDIMMLRRESAFAGIAVLCYSVECDARMMHMATEAGCDAVVAKHDGVGRLFEAVCACVANRDRSASALTRPS